MKKSVSLGRAGRRRLVVELSYLAGRGPRAGPGLRRRGRRAEDRPARRELHLQEPRPLQGDDGRNEARRQERRGVGQRPSAIESPSSTKRWATPQGNPRLQAKEEELAKAPGRPCRAGPVAEERVPATRKPRSTTTCIRRSCRPPTTSAKQNGIDMVLRFNSEPVDVDKPDSVLQFINKPVVWYQYATGHHRHDPLAS